MGRKTSLKKSSWGAASKPDQRGCRLVRGGCGRRHEAQITAYFVQRPRQIASEPACAGAPYRILQVFDLLQHAVEPGLHPFPRLFQHLKRRKGRAFTLSICAKSAPAVFAVPAPLPDVPASRGTSGIDRAVGMTNLSSSSVISDFARRAACSTSGRGKT